MQWQHTFQDFLVHLQTERRASANTVMAYRNDLAQFADYMSNTLALPADANWSHITQDQLNEFVASMAGRYAASTSARKIAALKTLFHYLNQKGFIADDPSLHLRAPRIEKKTPHMLSEETIYRFFDSMTVTANPNPTPQSLRDRALLELIYSTGMRVSEAIQLKLNDVDFEHGIARCEGKGTRHRTAPLTLRAVHALTEYVQRARNVVLGENAGDYIFLNPLGTRLTRQAVWMTTRKYAKQAGLGIEGALTPHTLRHSRAAHMLSAGEDVRKVREWFGHANLATTQAYAQKETGLAVVRTNGEDEAI